jgi:hypothetical protein
MTAAMMRVRLPVLADVDDVLPGLVDRIMAAVAGDEEASRRLGALTRCQDPPSTTLQ